MLILVIAQRENAMESAKRKKPPAMQMASLVLVGPVGLEPTTN